MVVHGSVKSSQPVKRNADSECFREFHWHSERIYMEQGEVKRLSTYVYSTGKPNS